MKPSLMRRMTGGAAGFRATDCQLLFAIIAVIAAISGHRQGDRSTTQAKACRSLHARFERQGMVRVLTDAKKTRKRES